MTDQHWAYVITPPARRDLRRLDRPIKKRIVDALDHFVADPQASDIRNPARYQPAWRPARSRPSVQMHQLFTAREPREFAVCFFVGERLVGIRSVIVTGETEAKAWDDVHGTVIHTALSEGRPLAA